MKITLDIDSLPLEEQQAIYKHLKEKFEAVRLGENFNIFDKNIYDDCLRGIISGSTYKALRALDVKTIRDLMKLSRRELPRQRNIGSVKFRRIEEYMKFYGLKFKDDDENKVDLTSDWL